MFLRGIRAAYESRHGPVPPHLEEEFRKRVDALRGRPNRRTRRRAAVLARKGRA